MSRQTTEARAEASCWAEKWQSHRQWCRACSRAARRRRWEELCPTGAATRAAHVESQRELDRQRWLDRQPPPGQLALF